jgi:hypothetical protein
MGDERSHYQRFVMTYEFEWTPWKISILGVVLHLTLMVYAKTGALTVGKTHRIQTASPLTHRAVGCLRRFVSHVARLGTISVAQTVPTVAIAFTPLTDQPRIYNH